MEKRKTNIDETWMNFLRKKSKDELMLVMYERASYTPKLIALVKKVLIEEHGCTEDELNSTPDPNRLIEGEPGARQLFLEVLDRLGSGRSILFENEDLEDDGTCPISFHWDNHSFCGYASNESAYVVIYFICQSFKMQNEEKTAMIKEVINRVNESYEHATLSYTIDETMKVMYVECRSRFLFIPLIPYISFYLYSQLKLILEANELFQSAWKEILKQIYDKKNNNP